MKGYEVDYFKGELMMSEAESILFFVSDGDLVRSEKSKVKSKRSKVLLYYYQKRVSRLNELLAGIKQLKNTKKE